MLGPRLVCHWTRLALTGSIPAKQYGPNLARGNACPGLSYPYTPGYSTPEFSGLSLRSSRVFPKTNRLSPFSPIVLASCYRKRRGGGGWVDSSENLLGMNHCCQQAFDTCPPGQIRSLSQYQAFINQGTPTENSASCVFIKVSMCTDYSL